MLTLEDNSLAFDFSNLHRDARLSISFTRTLRVPDDGREYPLPPGFGHFPLRHLDDYEAKLPADHVRRGGVIMPMHQAEAAWLYFSGYGLPDYPFAVKIAAGKINAITGESLVDGLASDPQNYLVAPNQPWLDGFRIASGQVGQFIAMPLGQSYTVEEQLTGTAKWGGMQIVVYPMKAEVYERMKEQRRNEPVWVRGLCEPNDNFFESFGFSRGGKIRQKIITDRYGLDVWDLTRSHRCFVTVLNSAQWRTVTGEAPPHRPPSASVYTKAGLPWFDYYDDNMDVAAPAAVLGKVKSVAKVAAEAGQQTFDFGDSVSPKSIVGIMAPAEGRPVREYST